MNASNGLLHSLLFGGERELVNVKFFPGADLGLTANRLSDAAAAAIDAVLSRGPVNSPPTTRRQKAMLKDFHPPG